MKRDDLAHMSRAIALATRGEGTTHPNPRVGAVLVRGGEVVGEGWHRAPGEPHAEPLALARAGELARGATLFVNLEPCSHHGRTAPCSGSLVAAGVKRVVASCRDPNPEVDGRGFARLRRAGVEVVTGVMEEEARELNRAYLHWRGTGLPFLTLKLAQSLDGRIAAASGRSRWITGEGARRQVHRLRASSDAVMVGAGTVLADDPALTVRLGGVRRQPARVILDPSLSIPLASRVVAGAGDGQTLVVIGREVAPARRAPFLARGVRLLPLPTRGGLFSWSRLGGALAGLGYLSLLAEGGSATAAWLWREGAVSRLELFVAPLLLGGDGVPSLGPLGVRAPERAPRLQILSRRKVGDDLRITARPVWDDRRAGT